MFVFIVCLFYFVFYLWQRYRLAYKDAPATVPFWSCVKIILSDTDTWTKSQRICKLVEECGGVACGFFYSRGFRGMYVVTNPEDSGKVLKACLTKDEIYLNWTPWLGNGMLIGDVHTSKSSRKLFTKSLTPSNMEAFMKYFNKHTQSFVQNLSEHVDKGPLDLIKDIRLYNLLLLCDTLLPFDDFDSVNFSDYLHAVSKYLRITNHKFESLVYQHNFIFERSGLKKEQDEALKVLHQISNEIICRRREKLKDISENKCEPPSHHIYIDTLLEEVGKGTIPLKTMASDVDTIVFAGHDTSAYTLLYALVLMGSYPLVQKRAYEEVEKILGGRKDITRDDLANMVYLDAVISESMRVYPYVPFLLRKIEEDIKLKNCTMRAGCTVAVSSWQIHRHKSWSPDVDQFRPERWLEDKLPKAAQLLSFSDGPRSCVGRRYAMLSMKTLMAQLLRSYEFKADHTQLRFEYIGVLEPLAGHHIAIERRV